MTWKRQNTSDIKPHNKIENCCILSQLLKLLLYVGVILPQKWATLLYILILTTQVKFFLIRIMLFLDSGQKGFWSHWYCYYFMQWNNGPNQKHQIIIRSYDQNMQKKRISTNMLGRIIAENYTMHPLEVMTADVATNSLTITPIVNSQ